MRREELDFRADFIRDLNKIKSVFAHPVENTVAPGVPDVSLHISYEWFNVEIKQSKPNESGNFNLETILRPAQRKYFFITRKSRKTWLLWKIGDTVFLLNAVSVLELTVPREKKLFNIRNERNFLELSIKDQDYTTEIVKYFRTQMRK